jgi:hypothetical protein
VGEDILKTITLAPSKIVFNILKCCPLEASDDNAFKKVFKKVSDEEKPF